MCSAFLFCWKFESVTLWVSETELHSWMRSLWRRSWNLQPLVRIYRPGSLGVHSEVDTAMAGGLFPKGGGWVGLKYMFQFPEWDGSIFPCPLTVFVGKNREAQHEFMLCIWWYQIISFWSSVYFYLGWGEGVCAKDLKMLQTLLSLQMTDRTQTWADVCLASVSVRELTELSCHISWAAVVVVLALMLNFVLLLGLLVIASWEQSEFCSQRLQQYSCHGRGQATVVPAGSFLLAMNFWSIFFESQFIFVSNQVSGPKSMHLNFTRRLWQIIL